MNQQLLTILDEAFNEEISTVEAISYLEEISVNGVFTADGFEGFDYINQVVVKVEA